MSCCSGAIIWTFAVEEQLLQVKTLNYAYSDLFEVNVLFFMYCCVITFVYSYGVDKDVPDHFSQLN